MALDRITNEAGQGCIRNPVPPIRFSSVVAALGGATKNEERITMQAIWKFPLATIDEQIIDMPAGANILCVFEQII